MKKTSSTKDFCMVRAWLLNFLAISCLVGADNHALIVLHDSAREYLYKCQEFERVVQEKPTDYVCLAKYKHKAEKSLAKFNQKFLHHIKLSRLFQLPAAADEDDSLVWPVESLSLYLNELKKLPCGHELEPYALAAIFERFSYSRSSFFQKALPFMINHGRMNRMRITTFYVFMGKDKKAYIPSFLLHAHLYGTADFFQETMKNDFSDTDVDHAIHYLQDAISHNEEANDLFKEYESVFEQEVAEDAMIDSDSCALLQALVRQRMLPRTVYQHACNKVYTDIVFKNFASLSKE